MGNKKNSGSKPKKQTKSAKAKDILQANPCSGQSHSTSKSRKAVWNDSSQNLQLLNSESTPPVDATPTPVAILSVENSEEAADTEVGAPSVKNSAVEIRTVELGTDSDLEVVASVAGSTLVVSTPSTASLNPLPISSGSTRAPNSLYPSPATTEQLPNTAVQPQVVEGSPKNYELIDPSQVQGSFPIVNVHPSPSVGNWRSLFKPRIEPKLALKYVEPVIINGRKVAKPSPEVFRKGAQKWENTLVGQVLGFSYPISTVRRMVETQWKKFSPVKIFSTAHNMLLFKFPNSKGCQEALVQNWFVKDQPLILRRWKPGLKLEGFKLDSVPIWVKISDIPYDLWTEDGLSSIASLVGKPLQMDMLTSEGDKLHYAKVYVEVDLSGDLPSEVEVIMEDDSSHFAKVEYMGKPVLCGHCKRVGHEEKDCWAKNGRNYHRERSLSVLARGRSKQRRLRNPSKSVNFKQVWQRKPSTIPDIQNDQEALKRFSTTPAIQNDQEAIRRPLVDVSHTVQVHSSPVVERANNITPISEGPANVSTHHNQDQTAETRHAGWKRLKEIARGKEVFVDSTPLFPPRLVPTELRGLDDLGEEQLPLGESSMRIERERKRDMMVKNNMDVEDSDQGDGGTHISPTYLS